MAELKTEELSPDQWHELLEPYGWADVMITAPAVLFGVPPSMLIYDIRVMLSGSQDDALDEWAHRSYLLGQAQRVVKAVQAKGYIFMDAPRIKFGGYYKYRVDQGAVPDWYAEAELQFRVHAT